MATRSTLEEIHQMIEDCEKRQDRLSEWEQKFIADISSYSDRGGFLSDRQDEILTRIWEAVC